MAAVIVIGSRTARQCQADTTPISSMTRRESRAIRSTPAGGDLKTVTVRPLPSPQGRDGAKGHRRVGLRRCLVEEVRTRGAPLQPHDPGEIDEPDTQAVEHPVFRYAPVA